MRLPGKLILGAWLGLAVGAGCTSATPVPGPEATVAAYVAAVRAGDAAAIHGLLDDETRDRVSVEEVAAAVADDHEELAEQVERIEAAPPARARARVPLRGGDAVVLTLEGGRWKLVGGGIDVPALDTPLGAVRALRQALVRGGLASVTRLLSRETRADLDAEIQRFLDDTADELDLEVEERGNEATVRTTSGREIRLVRESAEWHVVEIERW